MVRGLGIDLPLTVNEAADGLSPQNPRLKSRAADFYGFDTYTKLTGGPHTAHTTNPVPFIVVSENLKHFTLKPGGSLRDISPTVLGMLGIDEPKEMTGTDLRVWLKS